MLYSIVGLCWRDMCLGLEIREDIRRWNWGLVLRDLQLVVRVGEFLFYFLNITARWCSFGCVRLCEFLGEVILLQFLMREEVRLVCFLFRVDIYWMQGGQCVVRGRVGRRGGGQLGLVFWIFSELEFFLGQVEVDFLIRKYL